MDNYYDQLNQISQDIVLLDEGDILGLEKIFTSVEKNYVHLSRISEGQSKIVVDYLLKLLNGVLDRKIADFSVFMKLFSDGINLLLRMVYNQENQIDEPVPYDELIDEIDNLIPVTEEKITSPSAESEPAADETTPEPESTSETLPETPQKPITDFTADVELFENFFVEALEHLENVETSVLNLESDPLQGEDLNAIFRAFHTIKGVSGFLNLENINFLAHETETLLEYIIEEQILMDSDYLDFILDQTDLMRLMIQSVRAKVHGDESATFSFDREFVSNRIADLLKKEKRVIERKKVGEILVEKGHLDKNALDDLVKQVEEEIKKPVARKAPDRRKKDKKIGQLLINEKKVEPKHVANALRTQRESTVIKSDIKPDEKQKVSEFATVKVNANKLDSLLDMVGELVIANNMVAQNIAIKGSTNTKLLKDVTQLKRVVSDLQKLSMALRMVEIKRTFQKITRLVRDLSKKSQKPIDLLLKGEDTEIDRSIVDDIYEPLVHIIRNSTDHGIESAEERRKQGKPENGTINLSAYHQGGDVVIEVSDDGKGLDKDKILNKALERNLIKETGQLNDREIYELIFQPGFSTAAEVTDVSGRGVGMDIVRDSINKLRGKVDIDSEPNEGSKFTLKIPLTMAIIDGMIVAIGNNKYVLPALHVRQIFKLDPKKYFTYENKGEMIDIRDKLVPLVRLYNVFQVRPKYVKPEDGLLILVENNGKEKCFLIDDVLDKQEVVVKALGEKLRDIKGVSAGTILGDGRVGLILDIKGIFDLQENMKIANFRDQLPEEELHEKSSDESHEETDIRKDDNDINNNKLEDNSENDDNFFAHTTSTDAPEHDSDNFFDQTAKEDEIVDLNVQDSGKSSELSQFKSSENDLSANNFIEDEDE